MFFFLIRVFKKIQVAMESSSGASSPAVVTATPSPSIPPPSIPARSQKGSSYFHPHSYFDLI